MSTRETRRVLESSCAIEVVMRGDLEPDLALRALLDGLAHARALGYAQVLLDITRTRQVGSFMTVYQGVKNLAAFTGMSHRERCAVVFDPARYSRERASTLEAAAVNWGNPPLVFFSDRAAALRWLRQASALTEPF